jgi:RNA polymerase sigma-70 factor (ECF subfamily)
VDRTLVERASHGDRDAYEDLARASATRLHLTAARILRDQDAAEDATQQALLAIWRELPSLRDPERFEAWTYRLIVRICLTEHRRRRRGGIRQVEIDEGLPARDDRIADADLRDQLRRALDELTVEQRTVVVLHHYAGLPLAEIAEIVGVPYGTVGSRLHYALKVLRASLAAAERPAPIERRLA